MREENKRGWIGFTWRTITPSTYGLLVFVMVMVLLILFWRLPAKPNPCPNIEPFHITAFKRITYDAETHIPIVWEVMIGASTACNSPLYRQRWVEVPEQLYNSANEGDVWNQSQAIESK